MQAQTTHGLGNIFAPKWPKMEVVLPQTENQIAAEAKEETPHLPDVYTSTLDLLAQGVSSVVTSNKGPASLEVTQSVFRAVFIATDEVLRWARDLRLERDISATGCVTDREYDEYSEGLQAVLYTNKVWVLRDSRTGTSLGPLKGRRALEALARYRFASKERIDAWVLAIGKSVGSYAQEHDLPMPVFDLR